MKKRYLFNSIILLICCASTNLRAQGINAPEGYTTQVGNLVSMMEDLKKRVTGSVSYLNQEATDFLLDDQANRIGAMIYHLAATEKYYQLITFENRTFNEEEEKEWGIALSLGEPARESLKGKPISYYLEIWDGVRAETLRLLKTKDDRWLKLTLNKNEDNNHWAWYHVMEHQANHLGQIRLIMGRIYR